MNVSARGVQGLVREVLEEIGLACPVIAGARNHLSADRMLAFSFEVTT